MLAAVWQKEGLDAEGRIPANKVCPFKPSCLFAEPDVKACKHKGEEHNVPFSCASARLFVILDQPREPQKIGSDDALGG